MLIKNVKALLIGKVISHYDGWNGSNDYFKIGHIEKCSNVSFRVYAAKGKGWGVYLTEEEIKQLEASGKSEISNTIEGCTFHITNKIC